MVDVGKMIRDGDESKYETPRPPGWWWFILTVFGAFACGWVVGKFL